MNRWYSILLLCSSVTAEDSFDESPWFPRLFELQPSVQWSLRCEDEARTYSASASCSLAVSADDQVGIACSVAQGGRRSLGAEALSFMMRRQLMDDVIGDPVSITTALLLRYQDHNTRRDPFYGWRGGAVAESIWALGKEWSYEEWWMMRLYGLLGCGISGIGRPRYRATASVAWQHPTGWRAVVFGGSYRGADSPHHWSYQSGMMVACSTMCGTQFSASYEWRSSPRASLYCLSYSYPFGL